MTTTAPAAQRVTYREVIAEPRFRLLLLTRSLAIGADTLRTVALSMLIFAVTGSPLLAAMTYGVAFLPQAIGGTLLGALADRVRPRPLITAGYGLEAATAAVLALAGLPAGASLALVAGIACLTPVFGGASSRLMAEALDDDAYVLGRSLANIAASASQLLGLAAGGATVAALGTRHALLVTAACHLVAAAAIRAWLPSLPAAAKPAGQPPVSVLRQSWTVNRQLIADPAVLGQAFGLLSTGLMTFQGAGPALFGAVVEITSAGDEMALAGAAIIVTALGLLSALRK
jgi:MFS family permease